jgi:pimeloyl-ACP methyl ester carboxylesterase
MNKTQQFPEDQFIKVNGLKIRYWLLGDSGPTVLMIHGIGSCCEYWSYNVRELAKHYRVLVFDLPGFGQSDKPDDASYSLPYYTEFLKVLLDTFKIQTCHILAHSMGGGLAMSFSVNYPERVDKLVLLDNVGFDSQVTIFFRFLNLPFIKHLLMRFSRKTFAKMVRSNVYDGRSFPDHMIDVVYEYNKLPETKRTMLRIINSNSTILSMKHTVIKLIHDKIDAIRTKPTLVFWGKQDPLLAYKSHMQAAKKLLPNAQFIEYDPCGHIPQIECHEQFNHDVLAFLSDETSPEALEKKTIKTDNVTA